MKKTLLITVDFPPCLGGVSRYWEQLCLRLANDEIIVLAPFEKEVANFDLKQPYKIYREKLLATSPLIWPKWLLLLMVARKIIKKEKIEQILVGQILPVGTVAFILKRIWHLPYVISTHAMDITILKNHYRKKKLAQKILKESKRIITVSSFTLNELVKFGIPKEKIEIISPATDITQENYPNKVEEIKNRYNLVGKKIVLTIGRIIERKGHLEMLKSLPKVLEKFPNTIYLIGSTGPFEDKLKEYIKMNNLAGQVIFTGEIPQDELSSFYQVADVFVMPTTELSDGDVEGFGIVYLEANACGLPVIATHKGGVADAVIDGKTGLLINSSDPLALSQAIIRLFENEKMAKKMGEQGQERVLTQFNWSSRAERLKEILS